ncbi:hypothetical protein [Amycolatopsis palatopharyngis]|uniref:hypothetical protein n=1 Tax=Amycolatopsis palatopharyngis TaxID=187982 RepID=UPI000E27AF17|nr:hypothetical protein [Amycolatopsis palatopharyngis]
MKIVRSWPAQVPDNRSYVVDDLPRLVLEDYDLSPLCELDDDVILIEWDLAASEEDFVRFADAVRDDPGRVVVAPYRLYLTTESQRPFQEPVWAHRRPDGSHVDENEPTCAFFGFGLTYFPREIVQAFRASWQGHFSDGSFSGWHRNNVTHEVPIVWDVRPVHLHYDVRKLAGLPPIPRPRPNERPINPQDPARAAWLADPQRRREIDALLAERVHAARRSKHENVAEIDRQLAVRGYQAKG